MMGMCMLGKYFMSMFHDCQICAYREIWEIWKKGSRKLRNLQWTWTTSIKDLIESIIEKGTCENKVQVHPKYGKRDEGASQAYKQGNHAELLGFTRIHHSHVLVATVDGIPSGNALEDGEDSYGPAAEDSYHDVNAQIILRRVGEWCRSLDVHYSWDPRWLLSHGDATLTLSVSLEVTKRNNN